MRSTPPLRLVGGMMATVRKGKEEEAPMAKDGQKRGARGVNSYDTWADIFVYIAEGRQRMGIKSTVADVVEEICIREREYLEAEMAKIPKPNLPKVPKL